MKIKKAALAALTALMASTAVAQEKLQLNLNNPDFLTRDVIPVLARNLPQELGIDLFDIQIPGPPKYSIYRDGNINVKADLRHIEGSVGLDRNSMQLSFTRVNNKPQVNLSFRIPAQLRTEIRFDASIPGPDQHAIFDILIEDFIANFQSEVKVDRGILKLKDAGKFKFTLGRIEIHRTGGSILVGVIDQLLGAISAIGGPGSLDSLAQREVTKALNSKAAQGKMRDALFDAINNAIANPVTFDGGIDLAPAGLSLTADLKKVAHVPQRGVSTEWKMTVEGSGEAACARGLAAPVEPRQVARHAVRGDMAINMPLHLINKTIYEVAKQGHYCQQNAQLPVSCDGPEIQHLIEECRDQQQHDPNACSNLANRLLRGGAQWNDSLYLRFELAGALGLSTIPGQPRSVAADLPLNVTILAQGVQVSNVKAKVRVPAELEIAADKTVRLNFKSELTEIIQIDNLDSIENVICGEDVEGVKDTIEGALARAIDALPNLPLTSSIELGNLFTVSLDAANIDAKPTSIYLPFTVGCVGGVCANEVSLEHDCGDGRLNPATQRCEYDVLPTCQGGGVITPDVGRWIGREHAGNADECRSNGGGFNGPQQSVPVCQGLAKYIMQDGADVCRTEYTSIKTYSPVE